MLLVDTGPLVAYLNRNDTDHDRCASLLTSRVDELLVTPYVLTEACYLVAKYVGADAEINLVEATAVGDLTQVDVATGICTGWWRSCVGTATSRWVWPMRR